MAEQIPTAGLARLLRPRHIAVFGGRFAAYAESHAAHLEELDVNPLLVLPDGQGAVAVDALIRLREE